MEALKSIMKNSFQVVELKKVHKQVESLIPHYEKPAPLSGLQRNLAVLHATLVP